MLYPIMQQSKHPLTRWKFEMINISLNRHLQSTCKGFKDSFYLMVLILSFRLIFRFIFAASLNDLKK